MSPALQALEAEIEKAALRLNLPRKYSRLPRMGKPKNPFKAGTRATGRRVKRALAGHTAALAANNIPGKAVAAGAVGAKLGGPAAAAAAFTATEAASVAASTLLARSIARRGKAAAYLARRSKRKSGIYKAGEGLMSDVLDEFDEALEKARGGPRSGLIPYGSRHQYSRAKFFEARAKRRGETQSPRAIRARAYLAGRFRGGPGPRGKIRTGGGGIYKSSELTMDVLDNFDAAIEKAAGKGLISGGSRAMVRRLGIAGTGTGRKGRAADYLLRRKRSSAKTLRLLAGASKRGRAAAFRSHGVRSGIYKSDAIEGFDEAVEKARGLMPRGGSGRLQRVFARRASEGKVSGKGKSYAFRSGYLSTRRKGGVTGQGFRDHPNGGKAYRSMKRTTRPGSYRR